MPSPEIENQKAYWAMEPDAVIALQGSVSRGLMPDEAAIRLSTQGYNELPDGGRLGWLRILATQFRSPILLVLMAAGAVTLVLQDWSDSIVILAAVVVNAMLGFYQEAKAENTLALLRTFVKDRAKAVRDGKDVLVDARDLVPGDIVRFAQGDRIPADGRVIEVKDLQIDEAILTGESLAVEKHTEPVEEVTALADRSCMVFSGTTVVQGYGRMVVTATGTQTELGRIAKLVESAHQEETPLQKALLGFTYRATAVLGILTSGLFAYGVYSGKSPIDMFLISVATAVAAVPEGLPLALTVILAIGVDRLAKRRGVVRKLRAAETLGSTTLILTDKTGTLTQAKMELESVMTLTETLSQERLLEFAVSHADVIIENPSDAPADWRISGRPVEVALARAGSRFGVAVTEVRDTYEVLDRLPFNSTDKYSASIVRGRGEVQVILLGAPEALIRRSAMSEAERTTLMQTVDGLAEGGARVLALASRSLVQEGGSVADHVEKNEAVMLGLLALRDPVRPSVKAAIERIGSAGVRTIVVTGDHAGTATHVAREVGIDVSGDEPVLTGPDIDAMDDATLKERLKTVRVIARATPEHKLRIARAFKELGEVVAMTGDGVNDAPALREADIGVAVGSGSDVAKAAADLVLLDDDFETIVSAVEEGRNVLQNVRKVIAYVLSNAFDGLLLIGGSIAFGIPLPLSTLQILWVNLFTDSFPAMALAFEKDYGDIGKGPVRMGKTIFDAELRFLVLVVGSITSALLFGMYVVLLKMGIDETLVRTFIFASFGVYTLFLVFSVRSLKKSILSYPLFGNKYLIGGTAIGFIMMASAIYLPIMQRIFNTVSLPLPWVLGVIAFGIVSMLGVELGKWVFRAADDAQKK